MEPNEVIRIILNSDRERTFEVLGGLDDPTLEGVRSALGRMVGQVEVILSQRAAKREPTYGTYETDGTIGPV